MPADCGSSTERERRQRARQSARNCIMAIAGNLVGAGVVLAADGALIWALLGGAVGQLRLSARCDLVRLIFLRISSDRGQVT